MKKIKLTQGKFALVDDGDYQWLNQWKWHYSGGRAVRIIWIGKGHKNRKANTILMHRLINKTPHNFDTDHIDRNPLNNQKNNLRTLTHSQNLHNRPKQKNNRSGFKDIFFDKQTGKWRVQICINGKKISFGRFTDIKLAVIQRNKKWLS